ncbi:hypothetical protein BBR47_22350 [Brevibacillus brevis NBRC 100599]|uniref:Uncharacterized protein n=1 Tax=Brevibacillus brevis (strain 47 / JCM 6285 / NBRC 100599) TaxID=358681 RepID=C0ZBQ3_BREBN|nr:hypothetical protein BBR47_22350 [Brevibacillus brevis NBRC 100599]
MAKLFLQNKRESEKSLSLLAKLPSVFVSRKSKLR